MLHELPIADAPWTPSVQGRIMDNPLHLAISYSILLTAEFEARISYAIDITPVFSNLWSHFAVRTQEKSIFL